MPEDMHAIIASSIAEAREGGSVPESTETTDTTTTESTESAEKTPASTTTTESKVEDDDKDEFPDVTALLEKEGYARPKKGLDNRIPYRRTQKIISNALKDREKVHKQELESWNTKYTTLNSEAENYRKIDKLIADDPDRYLGILAGIHPDKYSKFIKTLEKTGSVEKANEAAGGKTSVESKDDPEPQPDVEYQDGSLGYKPETFKKWQSWAVREGARQAKAQLQEEFDKRIKPIEDDRAQTAKQQKEQEARGKREQSLNQEIERCRKLYGKSFDDDEKLASEGKSEILKYLNEHKDEGISFSDAAAAVMVPRLLADRQKIRDEVIEEANKRADKTEKTVPASRKADETPESAKSTRDIIAEAVAEHKAATGIR